MSDYEYKIVDDTRRRPNGTPRKKQPLTLDLLAGKTVLVSGKDQDKMASFYNTMRENGYKLHTRKEEDGVVMWAEPVEKTDGA